MIFTIVSFPLLILLMLWSDSPTCTPSVPLPLFPSYLYFNVDVKDYWRSWAPLPYSSTYNSRFWNFSFYLYSYFLVHLYTGLLSYLSILVLLSVFITFLSLSYQNPFRNPQCILWTRASQTFSTLQGPLFFLGVLGLNKQLSSLPASAG